MDEFIDYSLDQTHCMATPEAIAFVGAEKLADGVVEVIGKMREFMPSVVEVEMEVLKDPDCDCDPELALRALFPASASEETLDAALDRFDEEWWLDNSGRWDYQIEVHVGWIA